MSKIGILMLDSRFPRIPGDMGNAATWPFPVAFKVVPGASPSRVVCHDAQGLLAPFIVAAQELVSEGCMGLTTTCGFLSLFQADLAEAVGVPVAASSLMQIPLLNAVLPPTKRAGILTISGSTLRADHLRAAGVPEDTPIGSTEDGQEFTRVILNDEPELDIVAARRDVVEAAQELCAAHPELGALVLECTNMTPYAADVRTAIGMPVHSIVSFVSWFRSGLAPQRWALTEHPD